jgi:hypothetical protein
METGGTDCTQKTQDGSMNGDAGLNSLRKSPPQKQNREIKKAKTKLRKHKTNRIALQF